MPGMAEIILLCLVCFEEAKRSSSKWLVGGQSVSNSHDQAADGVPLVG